MAARKDRKPTKAQVFDELGPALAEMYRTYGPGGTHEDPEVIAEVRARFAEGDNAPDGSG